VTLPMTSISLFLRTRGSTSGVGDGALKFEPHVVGSRNTVTASTQEAITVGASNAGYTWIWKVTLIVVFVASPRTTCHVV
jgi:hypothetical protein